MTSQVAKIATGPPPILIIADLLLQSEIHRLSDQIRRRSSRIDVLINNAGSMFASRELSTENIEKTLAVNHIAPFLLTALLLDLVSAAPAGRIIVVASEFHSGSIDFGNLQGERHYNFFSAYLRSKLCNILFAYELSRRLAKTHLTVNCVSPGPTITRLGENMGGVPAFVAFLTKRNPFAWQYPEGGAITYAASSQELDGISGRFFLRDQEKRTKNITYDSDAAVRLWSLSEGLCEGHASIQDLPTMNRAWGSHQLCSDAPKEWRG
jgi:NAD(P)-dependent dehydrogenase (short-subunit alcohol dehydrogenase family)